jgi:superfamily I DNA/RNA helicase/mRNA-degrading endonuclease RelE of RelBE toxin-antitoxin system
MTFLLSSTFTDSLTRLTGEEQKIVKTTAFDLQMNPANPGHQFHKLDAVRDKAFWSVRVSSDLRIIVHKTDESLLLCYVDHHDKAYAWAERRKLETHPTTGAAQIVEIRETVKEITIPRFVDAPVAAPEKELLFARFADEDILGWGVPSEWLGDVRTATEESVLELADHLPSEAAEAILEVATGGRPRVSVKAEPIANPFEHPDAQRRFRILNTSEELERAFDYPWDKWITFLHPDQRELVERDYSGPARVSGSAGTGKTIVALHRAVTLAKRYPDSRVLLATFTNALANALADKLKRLIVSEPKLSERIDVLSMEALGLRLYGRRLGDSRIAGDDQILEVLSESSKEIPGQSFRLSFLKDEWDDVVDAWGFETWEEYRDVARLGRKTRLSEAQRRTLWQIFSVVRESMHDRKLITNAGMYNVLAKESSTRKRPPYEYVVVDEAQDISIPQLRFLASFGSVEPNRLFFSGDTGQRIFRQAFSWKALGIDMRGRCRTLTVNYRTSHQIRKQADRLLDKETSDIDGNIDRRDTTVSLFNGPQPEISECEDRVSEISKVAAWIRDLGSRGLQPHEICVCVRSMNEIPRAHEVAELSGMSYTVLDEDVILVIGKLSICTMPIAKGLEFRAVAVMACDDGIVPSQERIDGISDSGDLEEVYDTERHLLYVACTRARDFLLVTSGGIGSEFLQDLRS